MGKNIFAIDAGNKNVKAIYSGLGKPIVIPNVLFSTKSRLDIFGSFGFSTEDSESVEASIFTNGKDLGTKLLGLNAQNMGGNLRALSKPKHNDEDQIFSILATLGLALFKSTCTTIKNDVSLATCLPIMEYLSKDKYQYFYNKLIGNHLIKLTSECFDGFFTEISITKDNLIIIPEGVAALYNMMIDDSGNLNPSFGNISDGAYIIIDIGGGTVDITAVQNGRPFERLTDFLNKGILHSLQNVMYEMRKERPEYEITVAELDQYIRTSNCVLPDGNKSWDVSNIVNQEFKLFAKEISEQIHDKITVSPPSFKTKIKKIILTGGTVPLIGDYIKENLNEYIVYSSSTGLLDNVSGCYKVMKRVAQQEA